MYLAFFLFIVSDKVRVCIRNPSQRKEDSMTKSAHTAENIETPVPSFPVRFVRRIGHVAKITWLLFWLVVATLLVFPPIMVSTLFTSSGNFAFHLARFWAWVILGVCGVKVSVQGKSNVDPSQTYIIISNHQSHFDGPALALSLGIQLRWIAKKELLKIPIFGHCLYACGNIFIDRKDKQSAIESIEKGFNSLAPGVSVMFFAEGTRSEGGRLNRFKKGGFMAALQTKKPILPVTINGSSKALSKGAAIFKSHPIEVIIGEPIETKAYSADQIEDLLDKTRTIISSNLLLGSKEE